MRGINFNWMASETKVNEPVINAWDAIIAAKVAKMIA